MIQYFYIVGFEGSVYNLYLLQKAQVQYVCICKYNTG